MSASVSWLSGQAVSWVRGQIWFEETCQLVCGHHEETTPGGSKLSCLLSQSTDPAVILTNTEFQGFGKFYCIQSDYTGHEVRLLLVSAKTSVPRTMGAKYLYFLKTGARPSVLNALLCGRLGV